MIVVLYEFASGGAHGSTFAAAMGLQSNVARGRPWSCALLLLGEASCEARAISTFLGDLSGAGAGRNVAGSNDGTTALACVGARGWSLNRRCCSRHGAAMSASETWRLRCY